MTANAHQTLEGFVAYYQAGGINPLPWKTYDFGSVVSLVLHRDSPFQAELFILKPGVGFPREHRHPDVDSYEYIVSACVPLIVNGRDVRGGDGRIQYAPTKPNSGVGANCIRPSFDNYGAKYQVKSTDWHGVGDVPNGGAFMSFQMWKNGVAPTSVGLNWEGTPVSPEHRELLKQPGAKWIKTLRGQMDNGELIMENAPDREIIHSPLSIINS